MRCLCADVSEPLSLPAQVQAAAEPAAEANPGKPTKPVAEF